MKIRLEHANLSVRHLDEMVRFVTTAFPEFEIRAEGTGMRGQRWLHLGTDDTYLALNEASERAEPRPPYSGTPGFNHLGFEVDDVDAVHRHCADNDIEILWGPEDMPWGVREMHVRHPDGHVFRISRGIDDER